MPKEDANNDSPLIGSNRQFSTYGLIKVREKEDVGSMCASNVDPTLIVSTIGQEEISSKWYECSCEDVDAFKADIRIIKEKITLEELANFNNTGNVCLWPSEEVLAYYCMRNIDLFQGKTVCELGSGMTSLAGLAIGITSNAKEVILTDGNERSIKNVEIILNENGSKHRFGKTSMTCRQLRWGCEMDIVDYREKIDVIICADCLYFDESRETLVETINELLTKSGKALILAPNRGNTFGKFTDLARVRFIVEEMKIYDEKVWQMKEHLSETLDPSYYSNDLHYPRMIILRRQI